MKRIVCSFSAVLFLLCVVASCFSYSVSADFSEQPLIRFKGASTTYETLIDQTDLNMVSTRYNSVFDLNRIRIVNTSNLSGQYLLYQIILVPCVNAIDPNPTIAPKSGSITITSMSGANSASISCTPVSIKTVSSGEAARWNKALLVSVQVIVADSSNDNINLNFNPVALYSINSTSNYFIACYKVNCYSSDSPAFWTIQNEISRFYNDFNSRMPAFYGYTWNSISFNGNGGATVTQETGTWWEAMLNSVKNLQLDISKSAAYQAQIDYASTDEDDNNALGLALDKINNSNAIGIFSSFDVDELAPNDPGELASLIGESITDWFTAQNKQNIDNVPRYRDDNDVWVTPYSDNLQALLDLIEEGGNEDGSDSAD